MSASAWATWIEVEGRPMLKVSTLGDQETYLYFRETTAAAVARAIVEAGPAPLPEPTESEEAAS